MSRSIGSSSLWARVPCGAASPVVCSDELVFIQGIEALMLLVSWQQDKQGHRGEREADISCGSFYRAFWKVTALLLQPNVDLHWGEKVFA